MNNCRWDKNTYQCLSVPLLAGHGMQRGIGAGRGFARREYMGTIHWVGHEIHCLFDRLTVSICDSSSRGIEGWCDLRYKEGGGARTHLERHLLLDHFSDTTWAATLPCSSKSIARWWYRSHLWWSHLGGETASLQWMIVLSSTGSGIDKGTTEQKEGDCAVAYLVTIYKAQINRKEKDRSAVRKWRKDKEWSKESWDGLPSLGTAARSFSSISC